MHGCFHANVSHKLVINVSLQMGKREAYFAGETRVISRRVLNERVLGMNAGWRKENAWTGRSPSTKASRRHFPWNSFRRHGGFRHSAPRLQTKSKTLYYYSIFIGDGERPLTRPCTVNKIQRNLFRKKYENIRSLRSLIDWKKILNFPFSVSFTCVNKYRNNYIYKYYMYYIHN